MDYESIFSVSASKMKASKIRELMKYAAMDGVISFGGGSPDSANFPFDDIRNIINGWDNKKMAVAMQYGTTDGYPPLIEAIKNRMINLKKLNPEGQKIMVTTGGQQGIYLISKVLVSADDVVLVEEPSFIGAMASFLSNQAELVGVPLESDGVNLDKLEQTVIRLTKEGKKPKFFYTIPNFQNPAGVTMSQAKRQRLYELSKKYQLVILEDDPYGDLYFSGNADDYRPIKSYGNEAPIVYSGSFSKVLCPGFRLGWVFGDEQLIGKAGIAKQSVDACSSAFGQVLACDYLNSGVIDNYLTKMRGIYKEKKDFMVECIAKYMPTCKATNPNGGFFLYVDLPNGISGDALFKKTIQKNVAFVTGEPFHVDPVEGDKHLRFSYSGSSLENIEKGIKVIGEAVKDFS